MGKDHVIRSDTHGAIRRVAEQYSRHREGDAPLGAGS
jgi:hypothetical protein